jgi:ribosomal protein S18 acetylase RimI-like enzyme
MSSTIRIRPAKSDDRAFVLSLLPRMTSFELPRWRTPEEVVAGDHRPLDAWFDNPTPGEALLIADVEGRAAGYSYLVVLTDFFTGKTHAHLSVLAVAKEAEGRGVGSALIEASAAWARARGDDRITLNVFNGNQRAQALYERHGYERETIKYVKQL